MSNNMMISVIIPTYCRYEMLKEAVQSVLSQTYKNVEIIVVDDFSGDGTVRIAEIYPQVTYLCNSQNGGPGFSRRRGLLQSRGDYIVFLDDDDYYTDNVFFATAIAQLEQNPDCLFISANCDVLDVETNSVEESRMNIIGKYNAIDYLQGFPYQNKKPKSTFTTVFRRSALLSSGIPNMKMVNDMAIYMRCLAQKGNVIFIPNKVGIYRVHCANISKLIQADFLIENLIEKHDVLARIQNQMLFGDYTSWWRAQIEATVSYYVYDSRPAIIDFYKVRKWCILHSENKQEIRALFAKYQSELLDYHICDIKSRIKKVLGLK